MSSFSRRFVLPLAVIVPACLVRPSGTGFATDWTIENVIYGLFEQPTESSLQLDAREYPSIAYIARTYNSVVLVLARWDGARWQREAVAADLEQFGGTPSLALDAEGNPLIAYGDCDGDACGLMLARWDGSSWQTEVVDSGFCGPMYPSLVLDGGGRPVIAYRRRNTCDWHSIDADLKLARWNGSSWDTEIVAPDAERPSLALDAQDNPVISYSFSSPLGDDLEVRLARWNGSSWDVQVIDADRSTCSADRLVLDGNGDPIVSYVDALGAAPALTVASWNGSSWQSQVVETFTSEPGNHSLALDRTGDPALTYDEPEAQVLKYAQWNGSTWDVEIVDDIPSSFYPLPASDSSLVMDAGGDPVISFDGACGLDACLKIAWYGPPVDLRVSSVAVTADDCPGGPGDQDGDIDPGEHGAIRVEITNDGSGTATGVSAVLYSQYVTVTQGDASFAMPLGPGQVAALAPDFEFDVPLTRFCGQTLRFTLEVLFNGTESTLEEFALAFPDPCYGCSGVSATVYRGCVNTSVHPGWKPAHLPLDETNDDDTPPFPFPTTVPGAMRDEDVPCQQSGADLLLYRVLVQGIDPAGNILRAVKATPSGVRLSF